MSSFIVEIWNDEREKCTIYTVRKEDAASNETDKFFEKYENDPLLLTDLQQLLILLIKSIGDDHGAIDELLNRFENEVVGIPPKKKQKIIKELFHFPNFPLRLYVLKITDSIIVAFNGGVKDGDTNQTSSLHMQWVEACQFAKEIEEALKDGRIVIDSQNRKLLNELGEEDIEIYR